MPDTLYNIPFEQLDAFYFGEVVAAMHDSLRPLATDRRVLHHESSEKHITSTQEIYQPQYSYLPWMLDDIFPIPADQLLTLGQAWILSIIDIVVTDHAVDDQLPDITTIPLVLHHLRLHAQRHYRALFAPATWFWDEYVTSFHLIWDALALEAHCIDFHRQPYTLDAMREVYHGKTAPIRLAIRAMGDLSSRTDAVAPLHLLYDHLTLVDQLLDDAADWKNDLRQGRVTLPVVLALESEGLPFEQHADLDVDRAEALISRHNVLVRIVDEALSLLAAAEDALNQIGNADSKIASILQTRLDVARHARRRSESLRTLNAFLHALTR